MSIAGSAYAIDLNYTIPNDKAARIVAMLKSMEENLWDETAKANDGWTDAQIAREVIRKKIILNLHRYETRIAVDVAADSVSIDNTAMQ